MDRRIAKCVLASLLSCGCGGSDAPTLAGDASTPARDASTMAVDGEVIVRAPRVEPHPMGRFNVIRDVVTATGVQSAAVGDCNDDGNLDVVTLGRDVSPTLLLGRPGPRFEPAPDPLSNSHWRAGVFVDLDGDGRLDLVLATGSVDLLRGQGGCRFAAPVTIAGATSEFAAQQVLVTDANLDGRADLSITQTRSPDAPHRLLIARGDGAFDEFTPRPTPFMLGHKEPGFNGFGMFYDDLDDDGAMDLFAMVDIQKAWFSWGVQPGEIEQSRDEALGMLMARCDPMSLSPLDYDRDGRVDWFVSGTSSSSRLLRHLGGRRLVDEAATASVEGVGVDFAWGSYSFDADLDGWPDILTLRQGNDTDPSVPVVPGPVDLFLNRHDWTFANAGAATIGLSLRARGLVCGPLTDEGPIGCFAMPDDSAPLLMVNAIRPQGAMALLRLRGTVSAFDATGARVSIDGASPPMVFVYGGQAPYAAEHARTLQIPMGDARTATVTVRWPSGIVQRGVTVSAGRANEIAEPEVVTLSRRVVSADGASTVDVTVRPQMLDARAVSLELTGAGRWQGEATTDAQGTHRVLVAPTQPGEARITVSLDGNSLRVRPRVIFSPASR